MPEYITVICDCCKRAPTQVPRIATTGHLISKRCLSCRLHCRFNTGGCHVRAREGLAAWPAEKAG